VRIESSIIPFTRLILNLQIQTIRWIRRRVHVDISCTRDYGGSVFVQELGETEESSKIENYES
jgi:hypothetical protein